MRELDEARTYLSQLGCELDSRQLFVGGERDLMSPEKLVLTGRMKASSQCVVIKIATSALGARQIKEEHEIRSFLSNFNQNSAASIRCASELFFLDNMKLTASCLSYLPQKIQFHQLAPVARKALILDSNAAVEKCSTSLNNLDDMARFIPEITADNYICNFSNFIEGLSYESIRVCPMTADILCSGNCSRACV